jgi:hypothetical protein
VLLILAPRKVNISNRSPRAGIFVGTYGSLAKVVGFGRLSRLRPV